jgi:hypothetical protein
MNAADTPIAIAALAVAFTVYCLIDLARTKDVRYLSRAAWVIVICLGSVLGGAAYLGFGRTR